MYYFHPLTSFLCLSALSSSQGVGVTEDLTAESFKKGIEDGKFVAVLDVRRSEEWAGGHIANATFVENLGSSGVVTDLLGCEECSIAVYCRSGSRSKQAIDRLRADFNFTGDLYNGLGVKQWTEAGYELVNTTSVKAICQNDIHLCMDHFSHSSVGKRLVVSRLTVVATSFLSLGVMWKIIFT